MERDFTFWVLILLDFEVCFQSVGCRNPESETSEILSSESPEVVSVLMYCANWLNMVQDEPLLQFFHIMFGLRWCLLTSVFTYFALMNFDYVLGMASGQSVAWI